MQEINKTQNVINILSQPCYDTTRLKGGNATRFSDPVECLLDNLTSEMLKWINDKNPDPIIDAYKIILEAKINWSKTKLRQRESWEMINSGLKRNFNIDTIKITI